MRTRAWPTRAWCKDKNGKPIINAYGDPQLDGSKTDNQPGVHEVMQEMRAKADNFNSTQFPGTRVLIGETYLPNIAELAKMYGTPAKPEFQLPMDTQVGIINKLDVAAVPRQADRRGDQDRRQHSAAAL